MKKKYKPCETNWTQDKSNFTEKSNTTPSDEVTLLIYKIETTTLASVPSDQKRRKIGVGEKVKLEFSPSSISVDWSVEGEKGSVTSPSGANTTYIGHDVGTSVNVNAKFKGKTENVTFNIVQPSTVTLQTTLSTTMKTPLWASMQADVYVGPEDVNFSGVSFDEGTCYAVCSGYFMYENGTRHIPGATVPITSSLVAGKGWKVQGGDNIGGGTQLGNPYSTGQFMWSIPCYYTVPGNALRSLTTVLQIKNLNLQNSSIQIGGTTVGTSTSATLSWDKVGAHVDVSE